MRKILNWRTGTLMAWIIVAVISIAMMPDLNGLIREKGQVSIPDTTQSEIAKVLTREMTDTGQEKYDLIAVFHSGSEAPLSQDQRNAIEQAVTRLTIDQDQLGIQEILSPFNNKQMVEQLVSKDRTTMLVQIGVNKQDHTINEVKTMLDKYLQVDHVESYLTGNAVIIEDFVQSVQAGVKKTELIAIIFILIVLIAVFRSPIVPLISLLTVGVSYLVSMSIVGNLVEQLNYPFSNFTQVFIVIVLFGIGTDYNILLYSRFKEELSVADNVLAAVKATFKTAGKTVMYSGAAVFIGFITLILAEFKVYRSASAVAIGIAVLLLALNSLNPFFMALLGKKMFWPIKTFKGHGENRLWGFLAKNSVLRPVASIVIVAMISIPCILTYSNSFSYNDLLEVDDSYASKQGITVIEDHFPAGFSSPVNLVIQSEHSLEDPQSLQALDEIVDKISKVDGISKVYSVTRPMGEKIDELYIDDQSQQLNSGIDEAKNGIGKISGGLSTAESQLSTDSARMDEVQKLADGTEAVKEGADQLGEALTQLSSGLQNGAAGAGKLKAGLALLNEQMTTLAKGANQLHESYVQLANGLGSFGDKFASIRQAIDGAKQGFEMIEQSMNHLLQEKPELAKDGDVQSTLAVAASAKQQLTQFTEELKQLTPQYESAMDAFKQANTSLTQVNGALSQIQQGAAQLQGAASELEAGVTAGATGAAEISDKTSLLETGLGQISEGQQQMLTGLDDLTGKLDQLKSGLSDSTEGLKQIHSGLDDANKYLRDLGESEASRKLYIPREVMEGEEFQQSLDMFMSRDRKSTKVLIILDVNPFTEEAMDMVEKLDKQVQSAVQGTELSDAHIAIGGKTSQNLDLRDLSKSDFSRTAVIMLVGIGLVLILITRSIWQPLLIIGSLVLTYGMSLGIGEWITDKFLGVSEMGWNIPFFSFVMLIALGVDYSIFLMMRYRETEGSPDRKITDSAIHIGGIVISAAIILSGTFAALMPSGVLSLIEIAIVVITGLLLLSLIILPVLIPACIGLAYKITNRKSAKDENFNS
ncbi:MMPL family transporter [Paenibacillus sp. 79R4]|uniref:MMPL family transporter n=1 Tax=Paenibacillus sp. 79R4 TaxID=2212847 RepID=UPI0015BA74A4|nr:MMPL family transporter [Paenibacillus sp. 79R4]NWL89643.1 MMPL family transporter [Paenibacillus sp. 79R4]